MRSRRLRAYCREFLKNGPKNTRQILDHLNEKMHNGTNMNQLGNVLARDPDIERLDWTRITGRQGTHRIRMWDLKQDDD
jgi:hypothetical protein